MCRGDKATSMCAWTSVGRRRGFYNTFHSQQTGSNKPFPGNEHSHRMSSKLLSDTSATLQNEPTLWTGSFCKVAFRSSASVEVVAPLAVRDGGVGPALRLRAVHVLREERDHARRPAQASVAAMYRPCAARDRSDGGWLLIPTLQQCTVSAFFYCLTCVQKPNGF